MCRRVNEANPLLKWRNWPLRRHAASAPLHSLNAPRTHVPSFPCWCEHFATKWNDNRSFSRISGKIFMPTLLPIAIVLLSLNSQHCLLNPEIIFKLQSIKQFCSTVMCLEKIFYSKQYWIMNLLILCQSTLSCDWQDVCFHSCFHVSDCVIVRWM